MNIRSLLNHNTSYYTFNREERNLAAILYHVLLINNNLKRFLNKLSYQLPVNPEKTEIYVEYAMLRDMWDGIDRKKHELKRDIILQLLQPAKSNYLKHCSIEQFNTYFGGKSLKEIENPGNWSIKRYKKTINSNNEFLKISKFKWCFNAKPDIVIQTSENQAICIEAKFKSRIGKYPSGTDDRKVFRDKGIEYVNQTEIQRKLFEEIIGFKSDFWLIAEKKIKSKSHNILLWKDAFEGMDLTGCPYFVEEWINQFS